MSARLRSLVAALLLAGCCGAGCRLFDEPIPARQPLMRAPLDAAALADLHALRAGVLRTILEVDFSGDDVTDRPGLSGSLPWIRTGEGLELKSTGPSALQWLALTPPEPFPAAVTIEVVAPPGPDPVPLPDRILWRSASDPAFDLVKEAPRIDAPPREGQPARATYVVLEPGGRIDEIRLDYVDVRLIPKIRRLIVREDPLWRLLATEEGRLWAELDGIAMPAAIATAGVPRSFHVRVPEHGRLDLSIGRIPVAGDEPAAAPRFEVRVAGESPALLSRTVAADAPGAWLPAQVDLQGLAGREVDLQFDVTFDGEGKPPVALWGAPMVVDAEQAPTEVVMLVVWDTTRRDLLSLYGHERPTTPFLEELGRDAAVFGRAYSQSSWTIPSMGSMLTGMQPWQIGLSWAVNHRLSGSAATLAEMLSAEGYDTAAIVGNPVLSIENGYAQGFDSYRPAHDLMVDGERITDDALRWVALHADDGMLLYVHYIDPHSPYEIWPTELEAVFPGIDPEDLAGPRFPPRSSEAARVLRARYEGELRRTDGHLRRLVEGVRETTGKEPVLIFAADHGEDFLEWGFWGHGANLHDTQTRVPLLIRWPGRVPAGTVDPTVRNVDIVPTILDLLDIPAPAGMAGESLLGMMRGDPSSRTAYGETNAHGPRRAFAEMNGLKYMTYQRFDTLAPVHPESYPEIAAQLDAHLKTAALYDTTNGDEATDVSADHPGVVRRLRRAIAEVEIRRHDGIALRFRAPPALDGVVELAGEIRVERGDLGPSRSHEIDAGDELLLDPESRRWIRFSLKLPADDEDWIFFSPSQPGAKLDLSLRASGGGDIVVMLGTRERRNPSELIFDRRGIELDPGAVIEGLDRDPERLLIQIWSTGGTEETEVRGIDDKERARLRALGYVH